MNVTVDIVHQLDLSHRLMDIDREDTICGEVINSALNKKIGIWPKGLDMIGVEG
ncbi:hypothetical protein [Xenorhabdus miraniensis]|uniref:Uncharacterized protein n=1 Tax=Xenorhabdus miraniensis TaxID=351674 RepID=A0A2D0JLF1_9GAMM|nr:hypothetical protein [Xenorhabdus miraniensis]PHM47123.1 hypothetical protein Xmir_03542 [Xenorhabdus miraniensis]